MNELFGFGKPKKFYKICQFDAVDEVQSEPVPRGRGGRERGRRGLGGAGGRERARRREGEEAAFEGPRGRQVFNLLITIGDFQRIRFPNHSSANLCNNVILQHLSTNYQNFIDYLTLISFPSNFVYICQTFKH